jgi:cysteine-rich repeat protein
MRRLIRSFLAVAVCIATASLSAAATYHVAPTGDDTTGSGSMTTPWREIRRALTVVQPGDTILVADGSYLGFTISNLGSTSNNLVIQAPGRNAEILPTSDRGAPYDPDNIAIWNSTNIVIDGLRSFDAKRAGVRIVQSDQITIRNGVYGNNGTWAIVTTHSDDAVVENCDLYGSRTQHGVYFANSGDRPIARGNRIHHNFGSGIRAYGDITQGGDGLITGALFEGNVIYGNYGGGGMNLNAFHDAVIRNNILYNNHASSGIALFLGEGAIGVGDIEIYHNTIDVPADGKYNLRILSVDAPITLRANILYNRNPTKGLYSWGAPGDAALTDADDNVVGGALFVSEDDETTRASWASWRAAGNEPGSQSSTSDALFVDVGAADYHLLPGSPAVDAGLTIPSVASDLDGSPRPMGASSDIGAYETLVVTAPDCGDGVVQGGLGEQCDDGNRIDGDCCSATCLAEAAGLPCRGDDTCMRTGACDGAGSCSVTAPPACDGAWESGLLIVDERRPGNERLLARLRRGTARSRADFGDPTAIGGTGYTMCLYDDDDSPIGRLEIARAGDLCDGKACWKALGRSPRGQGYRYRDRTLAADGVQILRLKGGGAGRSKLVLKAKNDSGTGAMNLPPGLAAALGSSTSPTVRLFASDAPRCSSVTLAKVTGGGGLLFRAER